MSTVRAFFAIPVPDAIRSHFQTLLQAVPNRNVRWTKPDNIHLTLIFLGNTELEQLSKLGDALQKLTPPTGIELTCLRIAQFPSRSSNLVAAYLEPNHALTELHQLITEKLDQLAIPYDAKKLKPHITLGRSKKKISPSISLATDIQFKVERLELMQSEITHQGSIYTPLTTIHL